VRSLISDLSAPPRAGAGGRRRGRQAGPEAGSEGKERRRWIALGQPFRESVWERWRAQSPRRQPRQEGVAETWVSAEMGGRRPKGFDQGKKRLPVTKRNAIGRAISQERKCESQIRAGTLAATPSEAFKQFIPRAFQCPAQGDQDGQGRKIAPGFHALVVPAADADLLSNLLLGAVRPGAQPNDVLAELVELRRAGFSRHNMA
jgi:hypothetical protein